MVRIQFQPDGDAIIDTETHTLPAIVLLPARDGCKTWLAALHPPQTETDERYGVGRRFVRAVGARQVSFIAYRIFEPGSYEANFPSDDRYEPERRVIFIVTSATARKIADSHNEPLRHIYPILWELDESNYASIGTVPTPTEPPRPARRIVTLGDIVPGTYCPICNSRHGPEVPHASE